MPDPENYYDDGPSEEPSAVPSDEQAMEGDEKTAVLPSELCPGMKPGDQIVLRVVGVDKDSYEVAYEPKDEDEMQTAPQTAPQGDDMSSMLE